MAWQMSERYPDPTIEALDPPFKKYHLGLSAWSGSGPAPAGAKARSGWATRAACSGATFPTTGC